MSIVKMHNKKNGITYVYESTSYWDKEKQQPRNKRKLIGKLDPVTGEIIPTERTERKIQIGTESKDSVQNPEISELRETIADKDKEISELKAKVLKLEIKCKRNDEIIDRIRSMIEQNIDR